MPILKQQYLLQSLSIALAFVLCTSAYGQLVFSNVAGIGLDASDVGFFKEGGCSFADYDLDGDLDLLLNTSENTSSARSYLLRNDDGIFIDVSISIAPELKDAEAERCAVWGDFNNDGYPDFLINSNTYFAVFRNNAGLSFTKIYSTTSLTDGMNVEGVGWLDYDNDGDLDFFLECHNNGIDLFQNDGNFPTPAFTQVTIDAIGAAGSGSGGTGLPEGGSTSGDFASSTDLNLDGYVDIIARRQNTGPISGLDRNSYDIFINQGNATFSPNTAFNETASNTNKGAVITADLDNDGDLDIIWSSASLSSDQLSIYEHVGMNTGVFTLVANPFVLDDGSTDLNSTYDGLAVGDIDNDGDEDIFAATSSGTSTLYLNGSTGPGNFQFQQPGPISSGAATLLNYGIDVNGDGEGCVLVDHDNDGDLDLYINRTGGNQLWQNDYIGSATELAALHQNAYVRVRAEVDLGNGSFREATNALVWLRDCYGNTVSGVREIGGGGGHGTQKSPWLHFGLAGGPDQPYLLVVQFPRKLGDLATVSKVVVPSLLPSISNTSGLEQEQTVIIRDTDESDVYYCIDTDNDAVNDFLDLDDDNDGIPDTDEGNSFFTNYQPSCGSFSMDFSSTPVLVTGSGNLDGTVYKYSNVATGIDALVTIIATENGTVAQLDDNASDAASFKPSSAFSLANVGDEMYSEFLFEFVTGAGETPVIIPEVFVNCNDIDGNGSYGEENWLQLPTSYSVDDPTLLTVDANEWVKAEGSAVELTGATNANPQVNFAARYLNVSSLRMRVGVIARSAGVSSTGRNHNIEFACLTNFVNPTTFSLDFDEDGVLNKFDLDSDNDGIYDLFEAGHSAADSDANGIIDGAASAFGLNGLFNGVETVADNGILSYVLSDSDSSGSLDGQSLDADNDGCLDVQEAGYSDANKDGILGSSPVSVDPLNGLVTSTGP